MPGYRIVDVVDETEIPDWERRPPKWHELVDAVMALQPGQALTVQFDDAAVAERARNAVRDTANLKAKTVIVRTRLQKTKKGANLYLARVHSDAGSREPE